MGVHIGRMGGRRMQISTLALVSNMRMSTLVLVGLTQTSTDASHRELNRSFFVNMPPTASMRSVHLEAHSERRFCVQVAEYLLQFYQQSLLNPCTECTETGTYAEA